MLVQLKQTVLQNTEGTHNKYYDVTLYADAKDKFTVIARWGRIEKFKSGDPQKQTKAKNVSKETAEHTYSNLLVIKKKKGYVQHSTVTFNHEPKIPEVHNQPDRTEVSIPIGDWWDTGFDMIEEREI